MFHYRKTYQFPLALLNNAERLRSGGDAQQQLNADAQTAFAIGWMTHCATDVTGHAFTNAKCGGPYRLHWQRHHLIENHMDAAAYDARHGSDTTYEELGKSALHFRISLREGELAPYLGRNDQPMYDYFTGFPPYTLDESAAGDLQRKNFFDVDPSDLPDHLVSALLTAMQAVYRDDPKVLMHDPGFNDHGSGRPNAQALGEMWNLAFRYLRMISSDGFSPDEPSPPPLISTAPFPSPPGSDQQADDPARGGDPGDDDDQSWLLSALEILLAVVEFLVAALVWLAECIVWLVTVLPDMALSLATDGIRQQIYEHVQVPCWTAYMAARRLLVEEAFLTPKPSEIDPGLVTLGESSAFASLTLKAEIDDPTGFTAASTPPFDEPSGRVAADTEYGADPAYPRSTVKDPTGTLQAILTTLASGGIPGTVPEQPEVGQPHVAPSQYLTPWLYPENNHQPQRNGFEGPLTHVGPWVQGDTAPRLLDDIAGSTAARTAFEQARTPAETADTCAQYLPQDEHLGGPVNYSLYLISRFAAGQAPPDMNLDSDRGYAWHCWDFDRRGGVAEVGPGAPSPIANPQIVSDPTEQRRYEFVPPCTVPEAFDSAWLQPAPRNPVIDNRADELATHYLDPGAVPPRDCSVKPVSPAEEKQAGMTPTGGQV